MWYDPLLIQSAGEGNYKNGLNDAEGWESVFLCAQFSGLPCLNRVIMPNAPIHVTVLPASTQSGEATIRALLNAEQQPTIRGIYRDASKAPKEFTSNPRFDAAKGDIDLWSGLDFRGSDAVFYNPPPPFDGRDPAVFAAQTANNVLATLKRVPSVKRLVISSAMGSQHEKGTVRQLKKEKECADPELGVRR